MRSGILSEFVRALHLMFLHKHFHSRPLTELWTVVYTLRKIEYFHLKSSYNDCVWLAKMPQLELSVPVTPVREKVQIDKSAHLQNGKELLPSCNKASQHLTQKHPTSPPARPAPARPHGLHS